MFNVGHSIHRSASTILNGIALKYFMRFRDLLEKTARAVLRSIITYANEPRTYYPHPNLKGTVTIGEGTKMENGVRLDGTGGLEIGRNCFLSHNVKVLSHSHHRLKGDVPNINAAGGTIIYNLKIGDNVFIGEEAVILPQVGEIGESAVIGLRSVVTKPVGPGEIWAGNPAVCVGNRLDREPD